MEFQELKYLALESAGYITEDDSLFLAEEKSIEDVVLDNKKAFVVGGVITAIGAVSAGIAAFIRDKKAKDVIKSHSELKDIDEKIKKSKDTIKSLKKNLNSDIWKYAKLSTDADRLADLFGAKTKQVYDGFYKYDETIVNRYRTEANPDFDPKKAAEWKKTSDDAMECISRIKDGKKTLKAEFSNLKTYHKELKSLARKYATATPEATERLISCVDKSIEEIDKCISSIDDFINSNEKLLESADEIKLSIFESHRSGDITDEEKTELLALVQEGVIDKIKSKFNKKNNSSTTDTNNNIPSIKDEISRLKEVKSETKSDIDKINEAKQKLLDAKNKMNTSKNVSPVIESSMSVNSLKLEIYESCHTGDITKEERDILLDMVE